MFGRVVELFNSHFIIPDNGPLSFFRWTSSLWKLLWRELLVYTFLFLGISVVYRIWLPLDHQLLMEKLIRQMTIDTWKLLAITNYTQVQCPRTKLN